MFVNDLYRPLFRASAPQEHYVKASSLCVALFAAPLAAIAYFFSFFDKMLWLVLLSENKTLPLGWILAPALDGEGRS